MLILTRRLGEGITIGDNVLVRVLGVHGRQVRLGINAPDTVLVHREEMYGRAPELWECCGQRLFYFILPRNPHWHKVRLESCPNCKTSYLLAQEFEDADWLRIPLDNSLSWPVLLDIWNIEGNEPQKDPAHLKAQIRTRSKNATYDKKRVLALTRVIDQVLQSHESD